MEKLGIFATALTLVLCSSALTVSCGSSSKRQVLFPSDGGEGGEAPSFGGGNAAGAGRSAGGAGSGGSAEAGAGGVEDAGPASNAGAGGETGSPPGALLYNTGVDADGVPLAGGSVDPHYTLIQSPDRTFAGPEAIVVTQIAAGYWLPQSDTSKWIAPSPNQAYPGATPCNASGTYVWRTIFDLTGRDVSTFHISGGWAADNTGADILLNGVSLGITAASYNPLTAFNIDAGFLPGINTLDFEVADIGCPNGLRVELAGSSLPQD